MQLKCSGVFVVVVVVDSSCTLAKSKLFTLQSDYVRRNKMKFIAHECVWVWMVYIFSGSCSIFICQCIIYYSVRRGTQQAQRHTPREGRTMGKWISWVKFNFWYITNANLKVISRLCYFRIAFYQHTQKIPTKFPCRKRERERMMYYESDE